MGTIILLGGGQNTGKSTKLMQIYQELTTYNLPIGGFIAPGIWQADQKIGFSLLDLETLIKYPLASVYPHINHFQLGRFYFNIKTVQMGEQLLKNALHNPKMIVFIDEIGRFELEDKLWSSSFLKLANNPKTRLIVSVREVLIQHVIDKFGLKKVQQTNIAMSNKAIIDKALAK